MGNQSTNTETEYISKEEVIDLIEELVKAPMRVETENTKLIELYKRIRVKAGIRLIDFK